MYGIGGNWYELVSFGMYMLIMVAKGMIWLILVLYCFNCQKTRTVKVKIPIINNFYDN